MFPNNLHNIIIDYPSEHISNLIEEKENKVKKNNKVKIFNKRKIRELVYRIFIEGFFYWPASYSDDDQTSPNLYRTGLVQNKLRWALHLS